MADATPPGGAGAVAVHRWFAGGEGWAFHPWFQPRLLALVDSLKPDLDGRRAVTAGGGGAILRPALGGVLVGEQVPDPDCPDPAARGRYPTVLRVVYLPRPPAEPERAAVVERLARLAPAAAGLDPGLSIPVAGGEPPPPSRPRRGWVPAGVAAALLLVVAAAAWRFPPFGRPAPPTQAGTRDDEKAQKGMQELLRQWRGAAVAAPAEETFAETAKRFLDFLAEENPLTGSHPDTRYARAVRGRWVERASAAPPDAEFRKRLSSLVGAASGTTPPSTAELLHRLGQDESFEAWWNKKENDNGEAFFDETADPEVSAFVRGTPPRRVPEWLKAAAEIMAGHLKGWQVTAVTAEDASARPWFVAQCYFRLLSRRHLGRELDGESGGGPEVSFVRRLPPEPLTADGRFAGEQGLVEALWKLSKGLNSTRQQSALAATSLGYIAEDMDYQAWLRKEGPPGVTGFVNRFRK